MKYEVLFLRSGTYAFDSKIEIPDYELRFLILQETNTSVIAATKLSGSTGLAT